MSRDILRFGELSVLGQDFAEATKASGRGPAFWQMDGVLGLGYAEAAVNGAIPPFNNTIDQGLVEPVFAFYFSDVLDEDDESEVTLGGINRNRYTGDLAVLPIRNKPIWELDFTILTVGNWRAELQATGAVIDTGTSMTILPSILSTQINEQIGAILRSDGRHSINCSTRKNLPDVIFTLAGRDFNLQPKDYVLIDGESCVSAFVGDDYPPPGGPFAVLGTVFLRRWYSVADVDAKTISFAMVKR